MTRTRWPASRILLSILLATFALPAQLPAAPRRDSASRPGIQFQGLPLLRSSQNHLLVRAFINDKPALLIVDTGSPSTVISSGRRRHFGLTAAPKRLNWPTQVQVNGAFSHLVIARNLRLGGLNVVDVPVVVADMSGAQQASRAAQEQQVDGILGADVLFGTKAVLDCRQLVLIVSLYPELEGHVPGMDFRGYQRMRMHVSDGLNSYVDGSVNGTAARLMVDTGAFATLLHRPFVRKLRIPLQETHVQSARINLADDSVDIARIRKLSVGLVDIVGKQVGVTDLEGILHHGPKGSPPVVGLLGGEILNRNHAIIDFGTRMLYLQRDGEQLKQSARQGPGHSRSRR